MGSGDWKVKLGLVQFHGVDGTWAIVMMFFIFAIMLNVLFLWVGFLVSRWAVELLFAYRITGLQFIAAYVLLHFVGSFFKGSSEK